MAVGTRATVTGLLARRSRRGRRAGRARQHLPPDAAPRARGCFAGSAASTSSWAGPGPVLTDSGGYQIFSLPGRSHDHREGRALQGLHRSADAHALARAIDRDADRDRLRHHDGARRVHRLDVGRSDDARRDGAHASLGAAQPGRAHEPRRRRSSRSCRAAWSRRCARSRRRSSREHPFDGFAIGGLAVGDTRARARGRHALSAELLPADRPRYLMGVGTPPDLLHAMLAGVDMFDCILPTQLAWQGTAFTSTGRVRLTRAPNALSEERARRDVHRARPARRSAARTCTTCSSAASRSARGSSRCTTCTTTTR